MKAQMKFQKYMCLVMLIVGALGLLYAFFYCSGSLAELGQNFTTRGGERVSQFTPFTEGKYDATLYNDVQVINNVLMYFGIIMIVFAVLLYVTSCNKRRNYYISNYVATGLCAGGNIVLSIVSIALNAIWRGKFLNVDFEAWKARCDVLLKNDPQFVVHYSESTAWFDLGFAVYAIIIVASVFLILNLVWKIKLMQGEKRLLNGQKVAGGAEA